MMSPASCVSSASSRSGSSSRTSLKVLSSALALKVEIIRGEEMPKMDATGIIDDTEGCDAYVVLRYDGEERFRSPVVPESYSPVWNCTHVLPIPRLSQSLPLILQVWDEDEVHDELIGQSSINFISLVRGRREERWYTITAEGYKSFRAVQEKTDTTHAGRVLLALTLDFAHTFETALEEKQDEDARETQIEYKWGTETTSEADTFDAGRGGLSTGSVRDLLSARLERVRDGINVAVKKKLYGALDSLVKACRQQNEGKLFEARVLVEEANRFADNELSLLHNDVEDRMLASKVAMACIAIKYSQNLKKTSEDCKQHLMNVMQLHEIVAACDDELLPSDPDRKILRNSHALSCVCTENQPGARIFRHRLLHDVRNLCLTAKEELEIIGVRGGAPNMRRAGRPGTKYPGPDGRDVDNSLELISCADAITLHGHAKPVTAVAIHGDWLFSASCDKTIRVWSLTSCQFIRVIDLYHKENINCLAVSPGRWDMQLFSGAENIKSYNIMQKNLESDKRVECVHTLAHHKGAIICMTTAFYIPQEEGEKLGKGWRLYSGSVDRNIHVYETAFIGQTTRDPDDPLPIAVLKGHKSTVTCIKVSRELILSGSLDATVIMWSNITFANLQAVSMGGDIVNSLAIAGGRVYVATSDRTIRALDIANLKEIHRLEGHDAYVYCLTTATSPLTSPVYTQMQNHNPMFDMPARAGYNLPLAFSSYKNGEICKRYSVVSIGIRKARGLEAKDTAPGVEGTSDPFCEVTIGGDVRISGRLYSLTKVQRKTAVFKKTLSPRWNEAFTFILPELQDYKVPEGSSIRMVPIQLNVWDWNVNENEFMGTWKGVMGDLMPDLLHKKSKVYGADGNAPPDFGDTGGWVYLEPQTRLIGKDVPLALGLKVGMSEDGYAWIENKNIADESRGGFGYISKITADGGAVRVVWSVTIGCEKNGALHADGWESNVTYGCGRNNNYVLQLWDDRPRQHGEVMIFCNVNTARAGDNYPLEVLSLLALLVQKCKHSHLTARQPHRTFLYSGSDDETLRIWDLENHSCVSVITTNHSNKVSDIAMTESGRLVSGSQDCSIKVW